jgi:chromate reductase, NAD(P)H dehydrogenase (quinone)
VVLVKILAISGSLQARSSNRALLDAAVAMAPAGVEIVRSVSPGDLPHFNPDLEYDRPDVESDGPDVDAIAEVTELRSQIAGADAVVIATPEYAHSLPGSLKNALDWIVGSGELYGKPVAILAGSPREDGAAQGRGALEQTLRAHGADIVVSRTVQMPRHDLAVHGVGQAAETAIVESIDELSLRLLELEGRAT